jgi:hypothetical protein
MKHPRWARALYAAALLPPLFVLVSADPSFARAKPNLSAKTVAPVSRVTSAKSPTSRLAQSDQALLKRTDAAPVTVMIKLDYDSVATYTGEIKGLTATSPSKTGKALSGSAAERAYDAHIASVESGFVKNLRGRVPSAKIGQSLRTVYGGVAATVPANRVAEIAKMPGVVAVQSDTLRKPETDSSPSFIGADKLYPSLGGAANAGKGVIFGDLDTGAWPEHPSFADNGNLGAPPAKADGTPRACDFGDNPLTPANDPFKCNNKLISGQPFLATYLSDPARAAAEIYKSARDSEGHGTHTASTAAGDIVQNATVLGVDRGPIHGIAPGAYLAVYRVCGIQGCFSSDSAAAVQQAIKDGVKVINFSIGGGAQPFSDPVELAFLDAYAAGVFVSASAGNSGPGAATAEHLSPWVMTVGASTQKREFDSTLTVTGDGATATFTGASITQGAGPAPIVLASAAPYSDLTCGHAAPAGTFTGKIVACQRGGTNADGPIGRVQKGFNVSKGGAAGMILYNPTLADVETDNHFLPAVHLADGTQFLAFLTAHPTSMGSFTAGTKANGQGDVMAAFSSRGPGGNFIKPDITAPGVQILAGNTPTPDEVADGPPGNYFMAIAGTSMAAPHDTGSALLLKALHPTWTPGMIKSAIMTTAGQHVVKEDGTTKADPFDDGAGRVDLTVAGNPGLTFDESAARMAALGNDPVNAVHLNLPSINAPVMPGMLTTVRRAINTTGQTLSYTVKTTAPAKSSIKVQPSSFSVKPGQVISLTITIASSAPTGQLFGQVNLMAKTKGMPDLHLPVAFVPQQGDVSLASECLPSTIGQFDTSTCTITAHNKTFTNTVADLRTTTSSNLPIVSATGAVKTSPFSADLAGASLPGAVPGTPSVAPGELFGYIPLASFGIAPVTVGDEDLLNFTVPAFNYAGAMYTSIGVDSNGYLVAGGGSAQDNQCCDLHGIPDPARPNNVLAPFWTDLNGAGAQGIRVATLTDGVSSWTVVEWNVFLFGTTTNETFQVWLGSNGPEDITFAYDPAHLPVAPADPAQPFQIGAENINGSGGSGLPPGVLPTQDLRVTSSAPTPGGTVSYTVVVLGNKTGTGTVTSTMDTPAVPGTTVVVSKVNVKKVAVQ